MRILGIDLNSKTLAAVVVENVEEKTHMFKISDKFFLNISKSISASRHACDSKLVEMIKSADVVIVEEQRGRATCLAAIQASLESICFMLNKKYKAVSSLSKFTAEQLETNLNYNKKRKLAIRSSVNILQQPGLFSSNCLSFLFFSRKKQDDAADAFLYAYLELIKDD